MRQPLFQRWSEELRALRGVRKRLLMLSIPWLIVFGIFFPLAWTELESELEGPMIRDRDDTLVETSDMVIRTLGNLRRDVAFLSELTSKSPLTDVSPASSTAKLFLSFAASAQQYDQVRWIDEHGDERLRVNMRGGPPAVAAPADLQSKSSRPYFKDSVGLAPGSVYFSELDLNVERGAIERPFEPTVRVTSPLVENGQSRGIVAINYRASRLLDRLAGLSRKQRIEVYLLNAQGYWILGPEPKDDWAWQLGQPERTLARTHPALWKAVQQADHGDFSDRSGQWAFKKLTPSDELSAAGGRAPVVAQALGLRLLVRLSPEAVSEQAWRWKLILALIMASAVAIALRLALQTGRNMVARKVHEETLQAANQALQRSNEHLKTVQSELARADRLSSLGLMVAGVAHELNTPLGSASLALSTVQQRLQALGQQLKNGLRKSDLDDYLQETGQALDLILSALRRSAGIVQRFKQVAVDRTTMEQRSFDLAEIILDADPRLRKWNKSHAAQLKLDLAPGLTMDSYPGPLEQVISNLLDNTLAHAFANRAGGLITLRAAGDGPEHVCIWFSDDGSGVPSDSLGKIFDPFFTTSRHAGGTGLGLHIVYQLVNDVLGGSIEVTNIAEPGGGTGLAFTLRLPRRAPFKKTFGTLSPGPLPLGDPPARPPT